MAAEHHILVQPTPVMYGVVYEDNFDVRNTYPPVSDPKDSIAHVRVSTTLALTMAILGSSVLPVSYAFATTGIATGLIISLVCRVICLLRIS
jgi:hypothetical protein